MSNSQRTLPDALSVGALGLVDALKTAILTGDIWPHLLAATVVPFFGSALWYASRTVIEVTDSEHAVWLRLWLCAQQNAIQRIRWLRLSSSTDNMIRSQVDPFGRPQRKETPDDDREDGGRFSPPKLEFLPSHDVSVWTWIGWWPISVKSSKSTTSGPFGLVQMGGGYTLTVWFAPWGTSLAKGVLFEGRQLWMEKRAKKTEIWMPYLTHHPLQFKIVTRPSRPLSSVIVENGVKDALIADTTHFLNAESWYIDKGIPYRRGILLHGEAGNGKTSLITALAGYLRLPIIFVQLNSDNMSDQTLMNLISEAPRDSIVLIEDIDCALRNSSPTIGRLQRQMGTPSVTLSGLLNALDGVAAQEGRLIFMTTNHVDRLDEALVRPGRVDVKLHLKKASRSAAGELYDQFFASTLADGTFSEKVVAGARAKFLDLVEDGKHSFAALQGVLMTARDDPRLVEKSMRDMVGAPVVVSKHCSHCRGAPGPCSCADGCDASDGSECYAVHYGTTCDGCGVYDFHGPRYNCGMCSNFDLCEKCYNNGVHDSTHPFLVIAGYGCKKVPVDRLQKSNTTEDNLQAKKLKVDPQDSDKSQGMTKVVDAYEEEQNA